MTIIPFTAQYTESVIELWRRCGLVVPWNDPAKDIERKLSVNPELFFIGTINGDIVASVMGGYEGHRGWINYLAVSPAHRRQGYGQIMMKAAEAALLERGCPKINLQVRHDNTEVLAFYAALGFHDDRVVSLGKRLIDD
jgi:ribosomal protein S18 acetylase RimI-like enzyme